MAESEASRQEDEAARAKVNQLSIQTTNTTTITHNNTPKTPTGHAAAEDDSNIATRSPIVTNNEQPGMAKSNVVELSQGDYPDRFQRLNTLLGKGANKEVFLAFDTHANRDVAWNRVARQTLSPSDHRVLQKEIEMMDKADHANIIKYLAWWDTENYFVFITDFFNMSLKQFIQERNVLINSVKTWTLQILEGLIHLHAAGIIHRDIKCDNVFINQKTGNVVIGDLGLSRSADLMDKSMSMVGTVPFMAPEQLNLDERKYGPKVDIYALGMTVLEMISGEYPFEECNALPYIIKNIIDNKPPDTLGRLREGPTREFICYCLTRDPADRPTAEALREHTWFQHIKENFPVASLMLSDSEPENAAIPPSAWAVSPGPQIAPGIKRVNTYETDASTTSPASPENPERKETDESEDLESRKFAQSILTMKDLTGPLKEAQRTLLPDPILSQMAEVDSFVEDFVQSSSVADRAAFQKGALTILEDWEEKRSEFKKWSAEKEELLQSRAEKIKSQKDKLSESRKKMESLSVHEHEIRTKLNDEIRKREQLDIEKEEIDQKIAKLEEQKQQLSIDFTDSRSKSENLEASLHELVESTSETEHNISSMERDLENLENDDQMIQDQQQHDQFVNWKKSVQKIMNEIQKARELEWKDWGPQEIIDWICRLNQGTFRLYKDKLSEEIPLKIDNGEDLLFLLQDRQTIRELGVTKIRHRDMLIQHIERLHRNNPSKNHPEKGENPNV